MLPKAFMYEVYLVHVNTPDEVFLFFFYLLTNWLKEKETAQSYEVTGEEVHYVH